MLFHVAERNWADNCPKNGIPVVLKKSPCSPYKKYKDHSQELSTTMEQKLQVPCRIYEPWVRIMCLIRASLIKISNLKIVLWPPVLHMGSASVKAYICSRGIWNYKNGSESHIARHIPHPATYLPAHRACHAEWRWCPTHLRSLPRRPPCLALGALALLCSTLPYLSHISVPSTCILRIMAWTTANANMFLSQLWVRLPFVVSICCDILARNGTK